MKLITLMLIPFIVSGQPYTIKDDLSKSKFEKDVAIEFNSILNKYRESNGKKPILWNDTLWIAAKNHCLWMANINRLTHKEYTPNIYFTGSDVSERVRYVLNFPENEKFRGNFCGENLVLRNEVKKDPKEIAKDIFEAWKASPPHNASMLANCFRYGLALYTKDVLFGVYVFY